MGASSILGHVATGFEQARQADLQRQFEDIQNRRAQQLSLLGKLASYETVHPDLRNWAVQTAMEGAQTRRGRRGGGAGDTRADNLRPGNLPRS